LSRSGCEQAGDRTHERQPGRDAERSAKPVAERSRSPVAAGTDEHGDGDRDPERAAELTQRGDVPNALPMCCGATWIMTELWVAGMAIEMSTPEITSGATICQ
jgi:hypothetical protein